MERLESLEKEYEALDQNGKDGNVDQKKHVRYPIVLLCIAQYNRLNLQAIRLRWSI